MAKRLFFSVVLTVFCVSILVPKVSAETIPELMISEVKIKSNDFLVLTAPRDLDTANYWLGYSSSEPLEDLSPEYPLPTAKLPEGESLLMTNDEAVPVCGAAYAAEMPFDLAETKGAVALWREDRSADSRTISYTMVDSLTWTNSKTGSADIVRPSTLEEGLALPTWVRVADQNGKYVWRIGDLTETDEGCQIINRAGKLEKDVAQPNVNGAGPSFVEIEDNSNDGSVLGVASNIFITEILPNPVGSGNDNSDEFIELYNPGDEAVDISGYILQSGLSLNHTYVFPENSILAAGAYKAFYTDETGLSLSNSSGRVVLKDDNEEIIAESAAYGSAGDGQAWGLFQGVWRWTAKPTPQAANSLIEKPIKPLAVVAKKVAKSVKSVKKATAKAAKTTKLAKKASKKKLSVKNSSMPQQKFSSAATAPARGVHPVMLAAVIVTALGYGLYEFRHDLANRYHQFRTNRTARRRNRR